MEDADERTGPIGHRPVRDRPPPLFYQEVAMIVRMRAIVAVLLSLLFGEQGEDDDEAWGFALLVILAVYVAGVVLVVRWTN